MDMQIRAWIDQDQAWLADTVRTHGWAIRYIGGDVSACPGCACETDQRTHPSPTPSVSTGWITSELLILGVDPGTAGRVLDELGERVRSGVALLPGQLVTFEDWPRRVIRKTSPTRGRSCSTPTATTGGRRTAPVPALQLTYDDEEGRFPWDDGYATPELQPRPGTFTASGTGDSTWVCWHT